MEYAYPPTTSLRPIPVDFAQLGLIALCVLTGIVLVAYYRNPKQLWLVSLFLFLPALGGGLVAYLHHANSDQGNPDMPLDLRAWGVLLLLSGVGLCLALVRGIGLGPAAAVVFVGGFFVITAIESRQSRRPARRPQCLNNLKQISIAIQNFAVDNGGSLPKPGSAPEELSWRVQMLPMLDAASVYRAYHRDKAWDDPANEEFAKMRLRGYACPSNPIRTDGQGRGLTAYALFTGHGTAFDGPNTLTLDDIVQRQGSSQTMLVGEACGTNIVWNEPRDIDVSRERPGVNLPGTSPGASSGWLSTYHREGVNVAFADGSVKSLSVNIDPEVLKALTTVDPGDNPEKLP